MSRFSISDTCTVDISVAYSGGINKNFGIILPGEGLYLRQAKESSREIFQNKSFGVYSETNKIRIISLEISNLKQKDILYSELTHAIAESKILVPNEVLLGILYYQENLDDLKTIFINFIELLTMPDLFTFSKISVCCTSAQYTDFVSILVSKYPSKREIFYLNTNMKLDLYDRLNCKSCREIPYKAYSSKCCTNIYCEKCKDYNNFCFDCGKKDPEFIDEIFVNSFLCDMLYKCKCEATVKFSDIYKHVIGCQYTLFKCKEQRCLFEGTQAELVVHAIIEHGNILQNEIRNMQDLRLENPIKHECPKCMRFEFNDLYCKLCGFQPNSFAEIVEKLRI
ncbi:hypothetical protein SteCoe_5986 [Stentor coeruleus]|uniref:Uncharacterized protein n=1 Tax=Stentor coeruleus TaxID=5963 RepID=A0A1R2CR80_9CILI|nr:hypothetical protein SteCoe_5986 [Stentor coeruleus]